MNGPLELDQRVETNVYLTPLICDCTPAYCLQRGTWGFTFYPTHYDFVLIGLKKDVLLDMLSVRPLYKWTE